MDECTSTKIKLQLEKIKIDPDIGVMVYTTSIHLIDKGPAIGISYETLEERMTLKIGELSKQTNVSIRSLRYYEKQGLITPERQDNGYREYNKFAIEQVETIKFYLNLGMTTEEISGFLQCVLKNKEAFCNEIMPIYRKKLDDINQQIELLVRIKTNLEQRIHAIKSENPIWMEEN